MSYRDEMMEAAEKELNGLKFSQSSTQVELAEAAARVAYCTAMSTVRSEYADYWDGEMESAQEAFTKLQTKLNKLRTNAVKAAIRMEEQRILTDLRNGAVQLGRPVLLEINGVTVGQVLAPVNVAKAALF